MKRFFLGLLGSWAGLTIATLMISAMNGSFASYDILGVGTFNLILAAVTTTIIAFIEKPTWSWINYAISGIATTGVLLFILYIMLAAALAGAFGGGLTFSFIGFAVVTITTGISGALTGVGYRTLSGVAGE